MALSALLSHFNSMIIAGLSRSLFVEGIQCLQNPFQTAVPLFLYNKLERCNTQAKLHRPTHSHHYTLKQKFQNENTLGSDRASSKGYIVRWVEAPSNKLLTTAFEASLESVTVTCRLSVDSKIAGIAMEHRNPKVSEGRHRGQGGRQYMHLSLW